MSDSLREDIMRLLDVEPERAEHTLRVSEVFGPTIQGEGPHAGRACYFIRLGGCNLSCDWCDTPYSTGTHGIPLSTVPVKTIREITAKIPTETMVVITGGEPLIHARREAFQSLILDLKAMGCEVHIETNGTTLPEGQAAALIDHFTISPKIGVKMVNHRHNATLADWSNYADRACLKAVWDTDNADEFVQDALILATHAGIPHKNVWVMPEGATTEPLQERWPTLAQAAADAGINASHRLHALAWGDSKGH